MASTSIEGRWAALPEDLLQRCSQRLCLKNLSAIRAVCRSWQSADVKERSDIPWLMLMDKDGMLWREFFCLSCQQVHKKLLPEMRANRYLSSRGWVLMISRDGEFRMLENPMLRYRHIIELPNWNKFPNIKAPSPFYVEFISKFVLSDCTTTSPDYKVMVIYHIGQLALWKPGKEEWTAVNSPTDEKIYDVIYYKGSFVAVDFKDRILRCNVDGPTPFVAQVVFQVPRRLQEFEHEYPPGSLWYVNQVYLVQSTTGSLLFVSLQEQVASTITFRFHVLEIDLDTQMWTEVENLENTSLFLGHNSSFSLEVDEDHLIKPNCIYFTYSCLSSFQFTEDRGDKGMGIYHLEDGTVELHVEGKSSPPLWIEPCF
ncbi:hypothetical protein EUGRSUZ_H03049 [Eucalyptus grandis]|uniref:F-box domain-containing protein n=2 Tax=Eucalyptus grandis TaxID=71139 RepID=A0A059B2I0_EUCGR|nr:hypothetical protein EUGRSUZ_H03049 [Eucalyptus grandis]